MSGYQVVPEALRAAQRSIADAASTWDESAKQINRRRLGTFDLGFLGQQAQVVDAYNRALDKLENAITEGVRRLHSMATSMDNVAHTYEEQDAEYYRKFGWIDQNMNKPYQPPH